MKKIILLLKLILRSKFIFKTPKKYDLIVFDKMSLEDLNRAIGHIIKNNIFDNSIYNIVSQNCTVKEIVDSIKVFIPGLKVEFVDHEIMNQLSYEVSSKKVESLGYKFSDDLEEGIKETIHLLGAIKNSEI